MDQAAPWHGAPMSTRRPAPESANVSAHEHGERCEVCGRQGIERGYTMNDRLLRTLFLAICRNMKLEAFTKTRKELAPVWVAAPDAATHDELMRRYDALAAILDAKLMGLTSDFVREHCGIELTKRGPT